MAFKVHSEHNNSILTIPNVLQLHLSCIRELIYFKCARIIPCRFTVISYYSNGILENIILCHSCLNVAPILKIVHSSWFCFSVTGL